MSDRTRRLIVLLCVLGLFAWVFSDVIFCDRNFIYRDAGQFYYPLLKLVADEWSAGRWPLWNMFENGGTPLLANPASAVFYPPRIVLFQWLPLSYAVAYKSYILLHVLIAAAAAYAMARHCQASELGAGVAAITFAFGAVVMFQYCNVIFLVGAAWVPLGLVAADRMFSNGDRRAAVALGVVLALQLLGGDPEAAYLTGGLAALYLAIRDPFWTRTAVIVLLAAFVRIIYADRPRLLGPKGGLLSELAVAPGHVAAIAGFSALALAVAFVPLMPAVRRRLPAGFFGDSRRRWLGAGQLALAATVAAALSAVQWLPTWEFGRLSARAAPQSSHEPYAFWVGAWRYIEFLWPNVTGRQFPENTRWISLLRVKDEIWEPSLYLGIVPVLLALVACRVRGAAAWRRWMSITLVLSLWAAMGPAGGPTWYWNRFQAESAVDDADSALAPRKSHQALYPAGGLYWFMVEALPGFSQFRYPAKLLTFSAVAMAALAAAGWDRVWSHARRRSVWLFAILAVVSLLLAVAVWTQRPRLLELLATNDATRVWSYYGPLLADKAILQVIKALAHGAIVLLLLALFLQLSSRPRWTNAAPILALVLIAIDIGAANRWLVATAPQADVDALPKLVEILRDAEDTAAKQDADEAVKAGRLGQLDVRFAEPFRLHRMSLWWPRVAWDFSSSTERDEEIFRWEKSTIQPKYGVPHGVHYTINETTLEPYDYWWFFAPFYGNTDGARDIVYQPRRGFDLWGVKYFLLPHGRDNGDPDRGFVTLLPRTSLVAESTFDNEDWQLRRNDDFFPRAWIVHRLIQRTPIRGLRKADRQDRMREILYPGFGLDGVGLWHEPLLEGRVQDPHEVAWIEHDSTAFVASLESPNTDASLDRCRVVHYEPQRIEIEADTAARGVMVVAEVFFPGWKLRVDGEPAEILRVNRMMRGVALEPGTHRVVFDYDPWTFRVGGAVSAASLMVLAAFLAWYAARRLQSRQLN